MVEGIEELGAELKPPVVLDGKTLEEAQIHILAARAMEHSRAAATKRARRWIRKRCWIDEEA